MASVSLDSAFRSVGAEYERAADRFGPMASPHEGFAVILEELWELAAEVFAGRGREHSAEVEARQVAAMALRYMVDVCGAPPDA